MTKTMRSSVSQPLLQQRCDRSGLLLLFAFLAFLLSGTLVHAATLSVSPQTGVYTVGGVFSANVRVNTGGDPINAAEGTLKFDAQKLSVISVTKGSIFNLWTVEPSYSNSAGTVTFGGGSPSGYSGSSGTIITVTFRAQSAGDAKVSFTSGSVLAADGRGTNVLESMGSAAYTIASAEVPAEPEVIEYVAPPNTPGAPEVTSSSHPDPEGWYTETTAELAWPLPSGVTAVRTLLDGNSGSIPTKVYNDPIDSISIPDLEDGVSYFHLQFRNSEGWGRVAHYRLGVDTQKPSKFEIALPEHADLTAPEQTLILDVEDVPSGIARYEVQIDDDEPYEYVDETGSSTITLPALDPGKHSVIIEAFDHAGNSIVDTFTFTILAFDKPQFTDYPSQINEEVIPIITGTTRQGAEVTVTVRRVNSSEEPATYSIRANENGTFTFIPDAHFQNGVYELTAVATDEQGAQSEPSDPIRIAVQPPGYIQIGSFIVSVLSVIVPLIALVLLLVLAVAYFLRRLQLVRGTVTRETKEALSVLDAEFKRLQKKLGEQKESLKQSRKSKKLTRAENDLIDTMESEMQASRKRVEKEVGEVDDIVE